MSSVPCLKDDNVAVGDTAAPNEQGKSEHQLPKQYFGDQTQKEQGTSGSKIGETTKTTEDPDEEGNQSVGDSIENSTASGSENEEDKNVPTPSKLNIEEVDSRRPDSLPSGSGNTKPATSRILLKRRSSRISIPTVGGVNTVPDEVDSAPPRASKRRVQKKKMVALFLESDFPRRK